MIRIQSILAAVLFLALTPYASPHEVRPAFLAIRQVTVDSYDILWKVPARGGNERLRLHVVLPDDARRIASSRGEFSGDAFIERWRVERAGGLGGATIEIDGLILTRIDVLARVQFLDESVQTALITPDAPRFVVQRTHSSREIAVAYFKQGARNLLTSPQHLLFVLALMLLAGGWIGRARLAAVFIVASASSLTAAALGALHVPDVPLNICVALSIVFLAAAILRRRGGEPEVALQAPWIAVFVFGLLHGLAFAASFKALDLPRPRSFVSLLFYCAGTDLGLIAVAAVATLMIALLRDTQVTAVSSRWSAVPYAIGSVAMFWIVQGIVDS